jgi:hypothetical protein
LWGIALQLLGVGRNGDVEERERVEIIIFYFMIFQK